MCLRISSTTTTLTSSTCFNAIASPTPVRALRCEHDLRQHVVTLVCSCTEFREVDVVKLVKSAIQGPLDDFPRGADLALDKLVATGVLKVRRACIAAVGLWG